MQKFYSSKLNSFTTHKNFLIMATEQKTREDTDWIQILSQYDTDDDGCVDYNEWLSFCETHSIDDKDKILTHLSSGSKLLIRDIAQMLATTTV